MRVLAINVGSSTLKFGLFDMQTGRLLTDGSIERPETPAVAIEQVHKALVRAGEAPIAAVAHRVAHGGSEFSAPVLIDERVEGALSRIAPLAPQHNPPALEAVRAARARWPAVPHIAVFDTAFHATLPPYASTYAVPAAWRDAGLRRYGFHGLSHQHVMEAVSRELASPASALRIVSCHLGNGASVCAIDRGQSIDTSMGLTALEGLAMGSRCGDLDPGAYGFLGRTLGLTVEEIERSLYAESGMKALSGTSGDLREIEAAAERGAAAAQLALQVYSYRVRKYIGAYAAAMGGCDAVAFTGGVGEHSAAMRRRILEGLQFLGLHLDVDRNAVQALDSFGVAQVQEARSRVKVLVVRAQEQWVIGKAAYSRLMSVSDQCDDDSAIPVAVSAHHVHLTDDAVESLFGPKHRLRIAHPLSQPGYFAAEEAVTVVGERGRLERVRVLGPCRTANQIEISRTEAIRLGVDAPLRISGDVSATPEVTLVGPAGSLRTGGVIVARRHVHLSAADAQRLGVADGASIDVTLDSPRPAILRDVVLRVSEAAVLEMHIDTDEANAAGLTGMTDGVLVRCACRARPISHVQDESKAA